MKKAKWIHYFGLGTAFAAASLALATENPRTPSRKLAGDQLELVTDPMGFFRKTPDFEALIEELFAASPGFAINLLSELTHVRVWTTNQAIPLLPDTVTGIGVPKAEVQIAVRSGNDMIFSLPQLLVTQSPAYILLHELLQGMVPGDGPLHHQSVRDVVNAIRENRGHFSNHELHYILSEAQVYDFAPLEEFTVPIFNLKKEDPMACALLSALKNGFNSDTKSAYEALRAWKRLEHCDEDAYKKTLNKLAPALLRFNQIGNLGADLPDVPSALPRPTGWFTSQREMSQFQDTCDRYDNLETDEETAEALKKVSDALADLTAVQKLDAQYPYQDKHPQDSQYEFMRLAIRFEVHLGMDTIDKLAKEWRKYLDQVKDSRAHYEAIHQACQLQK